MDKAVIVATSDCCKDPELLPDTPSVEISARKLKSCLENCSFETEEIYNRSRAAPLLDRLQDKFAEVDGSLIFYYCGHGVLRTDQLYLCLRNTQLKRLPSSALPFSVVRDLIFSSPAKRKLIILDCCCADAGLRDRGVMQFHVQTEGVGAITAAGEDQPAKASHPRFKDLTYFTGELIQILKKGIPGKQPHEHTAGAIADELATRLHERSQPEIGRYFSGSCASMLISPQRFADRLDSLNDKSLAALVQRMIGVDRVEGLPGRVKQSCRLFGFFCAKQFAWELRRHTELVERELHRWRKAVDDCEPTIEPIQLVRSGLKETTSVCWLLQTQRDVFDLWEEYGEIAEEMIVSLGQMLEACRKTAEVRAKPGEVLSKGSQQPEPLTHEQLRTELLKQIDSMQRRILEWKKEAKALWEDCCKRLEEF